MVTKILVKIGAICENRRPYEWKSQKSVILDVFNRQERHILCHKTIDLPNMRLCGP